VPLAPASPSPANTKINEWLYGAGHSDGAAPPRRSKPSCTYVPSPTTSARSSVVASRNTS